MNARIQIVLGVVLLVVGISLSFSPLSTAMTLSLDRAQKVQCILDVHSKISMDAYFPFGADGPIVLRDPTQPLNYLFRGEDLRVIELPYFNDPTRQPLLRVQAFDQDFYILESITGGIEESYEVSTGVAVSRLGVPQRACKGHKINRADLQFRLAQIRARKYPVRFVFSSDTRNEPVVKDREPNASERARAESIFNQLYLEVPGSLSSHYRQGLWGKFKQIQALKLEPILPSYDSVFQALDASTCAVDPAFRVYIEEAKNEIRAFYDQVASRLTMWISQNWYASSAHQK